MINKAIASSLALAAGILGGCAIHPLPEDFSRNTTYEIVKKIRCEAREALDNIAVRVLRQSSDPHVLRMADQLAAGQIEVVPGVLLQVPRLEPSIQRLFEKFTTSAVSFDFQFTIEEENDNAGSADFRLPFTSGVFTLGVSGGAKLTRENFRKFIVDTSFYDLHTDNSLAREVCSSIAATHSNIVYPITGRIGLYEVFSTFIELENETHLKDGFSDQLKFVTKLNASLKPKIELFPISAQRLRLSEAALTLASTRQDQHQLGLVIKKGEGISLLDARRNAKLFTAERIIDLRTEDFFRSQRIFQQRVRQLSQ